MESFLLLKEVMGAYGRRWGLEGRLVTGDAMFCQRDLCQQIVDDGGR